MIPLERLTDAIKQHMPATVPYDSESPSLNFLLYEILIERGYTTQEIMDMGRDLYSAASTIDY